jgi:hypothetical protein
MHGILMSLLVVMGVKASLICHYYKPYMPSSIKDMDLMLPWNFLKFEE